MSQELKSFLELNGGEGAFSSFAKCDDCYWFNSTVCGPEDLADMGWSFISVRVFNDTKWGQLSKEAFAKAIAEEALLCCHEDYHTWDDRMCLANVPSELKELVKSELSSVGPSRLEDFMFDSEKEMIDTAAELVRCLGV